MWNIQINFRKWQFFEFRLFTVCFHPSLPTWPHKGCLLPSPHWALVAKFGTKKWWPNWGKNGVKTCKKLGKLTESWWFIVSLLNCSALQTNNLQRWVQMPPPGNAVRASLVSVSVISWGERPCHWALVTKSKTRHEQFVWHCNDCSTWKNQHLSCQGKLESKRGRTKGKISGPRWSVFFSASLLCLSFLFATNIEVDEIHSLP